MVRLQLACIVGVVSLEIVFSALDGVCDVRAVCHLRASLVLLQAEDGIRDRVRSRGLGDVYKRQHLLGGARHLVWDLGYGFGANEREWLTRAALIGSIAITILLWVIVFAAGGLR